MRGWIVTTAVLGVVLAGCSGEDTPDPEPTSAEVAGPSLCELLPDDQMTRLADGRTPRADLLLGRESFIGCDVDGLSSFELGVQVVESDESLAEVLGPSAEPVSGLGDEAYRTTQAGEGDEILGETVVARDGDRTVLVRNDLLYDGPDRSTEQDTTDVVELLFSDDATELIDGLQPIEVADPCPSVDDVAELIGEVQLARAGLVDDDPECAYLGQDGVRFLASGFTQDDPTDFLSGDEAYELDGVDEAEISSLPSSLEVTAIAGDRIMNIGSSSGAGDTELDRSAFDALAQQVVTAFVEAMPES